jgi:O-antigen/teichoic acid export membrane protein
LAPIAPLPASVAALVLQPLFFAAAVYVMEPTLRPTGFTFDKPLTWRILSTGFTLYLTGMFLQANVQLERWYVARALGFTALGNFYLAGVWLIIFQMVPTSVEALFLARLVQARALGDEVAVSRVMRTYFLTLAGYCLLVGAATLVLAEPVVRLVLPAHAGDVIYVKLLLPGILIFTMSSPFAIVFNVIIRYQTYIAAYGAGAMITTGTYVFAVLLDHTFDLKAVILVRCFVFIVMAVIIFAGFWVVTRSNREFRFSLQEPIA